MLYLLCFCTQQLRVCSGHFHGGEKKDGDIPVPDPNTDPPIKINLPPPPPKKVEKGVKRPRPVETPRLKPSEDFHSFNGYPPEAKIPSTAESK